jgi:hypothetical protein
VWDGVKRMGRAMKSQQEDVVDVLDLLSHVGVVVVCQAGLGVLLSEKPFTGTSPVK